MRNVMILNGLYTKEQLESIKNDDNEIKSRFISNLSFGTAGLRGTMKLGTNAMNIYTVLISEGKMYTQKLLIKFKSDSKIYVGITPPEKNIVISMITEMTLLPGKLPMESTYAPAIVNIIENTSPVKVAAIVV